MNKSYCLITILIFLFVFIIGTNTIIAKTLYDNFSDANINGQKWAGSDFARLVKDGKLVSEVRHAYSIINDRIRTNFQNPSSINAIQVDVTVDEAILGTGISACVARVDGRFYKAQISSTHKGDIMAYVNLEDRDDDLGLRARWKVMEALDDAGTDWETKSSNYFDIPQLSYGTSYMLKIEYNGDNQFTFTIDDVSESSTGPVRIGPEFNSYRGLKTEIQTDGGSGNGYISASFDNVYINNQLTAYDNFDSAQLDETKWKDQISAREIGNGKLLLSTLSAGDRQNTRLNFAQVSPYTEATVTIKSSSMIESGDRGIARIDGYFYNDTYGPGDHIDYIGNVWAGMWINYSGDGTLTAQCSGSKTLDAAETQWEDLFNRTFNLPIIVDRAYKMSIHFTGSRLRFIIKDTVTGRMDVAGYDITTPTYEPYDEFMSILSRVYGNSTGGYMVAEVDDVYVDVAEPAATFDATGDWELTTSNPWADSGCELPEVGDTTNITVTQNGNDLTLVAHYDEEGDITLTGDGGWVYGDTYVFKMTEEDNGETELVYGIITLSQSISGVGNLSIIWTDGVERCESGFDVTITKSPTGDDDGGGGGGGGGCFFNTLRY